MRFFTLCNLFVVLSLKLSAQQFSFPPPSCINQALLASVTNSPSGATAFSWTVMPSGIVSVVSVSQALITFTTCGSHTVICGAYNSSGNLIGTAALTTSAICPGLTITPMMQTICPGETATLTASGATNYTWSNSQNTSVINPSPPATTSYTVAGNTNTCFATATVKVINLITSATSFAVCNGFTSTLTAIGSSNYTWTGSTLNNPVLQPSIAVGAGSYTVSTASTNSVCVASLTITQQPPLVITVSPVQGTTCLQQNFPYPLSKPVNLFAFGASTYTWLPYNPGFPNTGPSITVRPATSTCYTVTGATAICSGSSQVCITVQPQFTVEVAQSMARFGVYEQTGIFCRLIPGALNVASVGAPAAGPSSGYSYNWNFISTFSVSALNTPTVTFIPTTAFLYTVEVTDAAGCISVPKQAIAVVAICEFGDVGMSPEKNKPEFFEIYPNPANNIIFIRSKNDIQNFSVEISDVLGKHMLPYKPVADLTGENFLLNITDLKQGIYFINILSDGKVIYRSKVLKE